MKCVSRKRFTKSILFYCFFALIFTVGYFIGVLQSSGLCTENDSNKFPGKASQSLEVKTHSSVLIVVIFSAPLNFERRKIIRETWLLTKDNLNILHFFAIGSSSLNSDDTDALRKEHSGFRDLIVLESVSDSFSELSRKLLEIFKWIDRHVNYTFLLKVDDDSFVRLNTVYSQVSKQPTKRLYWGFFDGQARVKTKGKWKEKTWFLCDRYLPYAKGGGYILSSDLVHEVVLISDHLSLYQNEDVALGTWLAPFEIKRLHDPLFDTEYLSRGCSNSYLVTHKQTTSMMVSKFQNLKRTGHPCSQEHKDRQSYEYNWNVPPSLCCIRNDTRIP